MARIPFRAKEPMEVYPPLLGNEDLILRKDFVTLCDDFNRFLELNTPDEVLSHQLETENLNEDTFKELVENADRVKHKNKSNYDDKDDEEDDNESIEDAPTGMANIEAITEEEFQKEQEFKEILQEILEFDWNKLNRKEKQKRLYILESMGIELRVKDEEALYDMHQNYISINRHLDCRKYYIEGDNYNYEFFNDNSFNAEKDYCLSIGSCSFYPIKEEENFRYDLYLKYLDKNFGVLKNKGIIFSNFSTRIYSKDNEQLDPLNIIENKMKISEKNMNNCSEIWNSFKYYFTSLSPEDFKVRYEQSMIIQNMNENQYAILKFGQFQEIYGFLMSLKIVINQSWRKVKKFSAFVYKANFECSVASNICNTKYSFVLDTLHQIIIFRITGSHAPECFERNKHLCYPAFRNLFLNGGRDPCFTASFLRKAYKGIVYTCVYRLGNIPTIATLTNWIAARDRRNGTVGTVGLDVVNNYNKCVNLIDILLKRGEVIAYEDGKYVISPILPDIIIKYFKYGRSIDGNGGPPALLYSSKKSLEGLMNSEVISVDATFNMLSDSSIKCITVSYRSELKDGSKPRVFLGCIATLPAGETSRNYIYFFLTLRCLINEVFGGFDKFKVKTILTDESQAEMTGISMAFDNKVSVRNCVWHKMLTFERSLDRKGVSLAIKAIYSLTQLDCMNNLLMIMREYKQTYDDISSKLLAKEEEKRLTGKTSKITDKECFYWKQITRDVTKKKSKIKTTKFKPSNALGFLKTRIEYVYKSILTRHRWSLYSRINDTNINPSILKRLQQINDSEFTSLVPDVNRCLKEANKILDQINSTLQKCDNVEVLTTVDDEENDYDNDDIEAAAISISSLLSTQPSETIHSSLKSANSNKILNKKNIVLFTDAICNYFVKQDRKLISKPPKSRIRKELDSMIFTNKLSVYKKYLFQKEISALFRENYSINKIENPKSLLAYEDISSHVACIFCMKCRLCRIPCKHVMSFLLKGIMVETGENKKETVYQLFLNKLDKILMNNKHISSGTKRKVKFIENRGIKKRKANVGETMDKYGLTVARTNELLVWSVKKVASSVETGSVSHSEKKKALALLVNILTTVFHQDVPIIDDNEVREMLRTLDLSDNSIDKNELISSNKNIPEISNEPDKSVIYNNIEKQRRKSEETDREDEQSLDSSGEDDEYDYDYDDVESIHTFNSEDGYSEYCDYDSDGSQNSGLDVGDGEENYSDSENLIDLVL